MTVFAIMFSHKPVRISYGGLILGVNTLVNSNGGMLIFPSATCCFVVFLLLTLVFILLSVVVMICWWVADLVTFIQNSRDDGNHCPLIEDL